MKLRTAWALFALAIISTGCNSGMKRTNYQAAKLNPSEQCRVAIKFHAKYLPEEVEHLGNAKAYDTGFSVKCSEAYVMEKLTDDACALGADLINILEEKQPDRWSSCFRVKAEFLRFKDRTRIKKLYSDVSYTPEYIIKRSDAASEVTKERLRRAVIGGAVGGVVGGTIGVMTGP